uniref:RNA-dependent RNA polymerase n=1 Tax=Haemonchus placei TaxID=6290 RepID=A0A0N4VWY3_HAEPC
LFHRRDPNRKCSALLLSKTVQCYIQVKLQAIQNFGDPPLSWQGSTQV